MRDYRISGIRRVVLLAAMLSAGLVVTGRAQVNSVTLDEGETVDKRLTCTNPMNGSPTQTFADAGSVAVADAAVASATLVDPNGNNNQGSPIQGGAVESPTIRITGLKEGNTEVTVKISCPHVYIRTEGVVMAKHIWHTVTFKVEVKKRPEVPTEPGRGDKPGGDDKKKEPGGKKGGKGPRPSGGPDVPTYDPRFYDFKDGKLIPNPLSPALTDPC